VARITRLQANLRNNEIGNYGVVAVHQSPLEVESIEDCARSSYAYLTSIGNFESKVSTAK
jgi:hypothetical protein